MEVAGETSLGDREREEGMFLPGPELSPFNPMYIFLDVFSMEPFSSGSTSILFPSEGENPAITLVLVMLLDPDPTSPLLEELESDPTGELVSPMMDVSCWVSMNIISKTWSKVRQAGSCC